MRLDHYLPDYDFVERHSTIITAPAKRVLNSARHLDLSKSHAIRILFGLRNAIGRAANYLNPVRNIKKLPPFGLSLDKLMSETGFIHLVEVPNQELVIGLVGKFWTPTIGIVKNLDADDFVRFNRVGYAKSAINFYVTPNPDGSVTLSTETRTLCLGLKAKLAFSIYWMIIRPFSGLIRHAILRSIKKQAEQGGN